MMCLNLSFWVERDSCVSVGEGGEEVHGALGVGVSLKSIFSPTSGEIFPADWEVEISFSFSFSSEGEEDGKFVVRGLIYLTLPSE